MQPGAGDLRSKGRNKAPGFSDNEAQQEQDAKYIGDEQADDDMVRRRKRRVAGKDQKTPLNHHPSLQRAVFGHNSPASPVVFAPL